MNGKGSCVGQGSEGLLQETRVKEKITFQARDGSEQSPQRQECAWTIQARDGRQRQVAANKAREGLELCQVMGDLKMVTGRVRGSWAQEENDLGWSLSQLDSSVCGLDAFNLSNSSLLTHRSNDESHP